MCLSLRLFGFETFFNAAFSWRVKSGESKDSQQQIHSDEKSALTFNAWPVLSQGESPSKEAQEHPKVLLLTFKAGH